MFRNWHQTCLLQNHVLGEHSVDVAAQRAFGSRRREGPVKPVLHEDSRHAVAGLPCSYTFTDGHHFTRSVRARNARQPQFGVVSSRDHEQIAIIKGNRTNCDEHFTGAGNRGRPIHKLQRINAKGRNLPGSHATILQLIPCGDLQPAGRNAKNTRRMKIWLVVGKVNRWRSRWLKPCSKRK